uniref:Uncharacterized protein TCIL3000_8_6950 n=1 Tax=Trypanosoma congolense (strain IL3000) TaxID=1068625 RepID=G0USV5_TRYCI|nr:unnamed protein product [Trypanosoma congolense IL3000]
MFSALPSTPLLSTPFFICFYHVPPQVPLLHAQNKAKKNSPFSDGLYEAFSRDVPHSHVSLHLNTPSVFYPYTAAFCCYCCGWLLLLPFLCAVPPPCNFFFVLLLPSDPHAHMAACSGARVPRH